MGKPDAEVALPTKVVTLYGGRVYVNDPFVTQTEDCLAKFRVASVIQGVTLVAAAPLNVKFSGTLELLWLVAIITSAPSVGFL